MKKKIGVILILIMLMLIPTNSFAKVTDDNLLKLEIEDLKIKDKSQNKNQDILIRIREMNPSSNFYSTLSTKDLLELCLNNPYRLLLYLYGDSFEALKILEDNYKPLALLKQRPDYAEELIKVNEYSYDEYGKRVFINILKSEMSTSIIKERMRNISLLNSAYVYTPKGSPVYVFSRGELLSPQDKTDINNSIADEFPNAVRLSAPTTNYNCHSYAWYNQSVSGNKYWMNNPSPYIDDTSYVKTSSSFTGLARVIYKNSNTSSEIVHSALRISGSGNKVKSKWGEAGLYSHNIYYSPYPNYVEFYKFSPNVK